MVLSEYDAYIATLNEIEEMVEDDNKYPVIQDNKIKMLLKIVLEFIKVIVNYLVNYINASKKKD